MTFSATKLKNLLDTAAPSSLLAAASPLLPPGVVSRIPLSQAYAERQLPKINEALAPHAARMTQQLERAQDPRTPKLEALGILRQVAGVFSTLVKEHSACKAQCTHCCNIPVTLSETEAKLISLAIGKPFTKVRQSAWIAQPRYGYQHPCTFLRENGCSIYPHRPMACRTHLSLDRDDLLCQLIPETNVPVPLANANIYHGLYAWLSRKDSLADIREYFPTGL